METPTRREYDGYGAATSIKSNDLIKYKDGTSGKVYKITEANLSAQINDDLFDNDAAVAIASTDILVKEDSEGTKKTVSIANMFDDIGFPEIREVKYYPSSKHVIALGNKLSSKLEPACLLLLGDSTGDATTEWYYLAMSYFAGKFLDYTFSYRLWDMTLESYGSSSIIQTGSSGLAYALYEGDAAKYLKTESFATSITNDLEIRVKFRPTEFGYTQCILSKIGDETYRSYGLFMDNLGHPWLWWSEDGTVLSGGSDTYAEATDTLTLNEDIWLKCILDVDNGSSGHDVKFYTSIDGNTWTQLGTTGTGSGTTSIHNVTSDVVIGSRATVSANMRFYEAEVRDGIDGAIILSPDMGVCHPKRLTSFSDINSNTWTVVGSLDVGNGSPTVSILNSSASGSRITYSTDGTRFTKQTPLTTDLLFISYSHNYTTDIDILTDYKTLTDLIVAKYPYSGIVCVTQNPQKESDNVYEHWENQAERNSQIARFAARYNYDLLDVCRAFMDTTDYEDLISSDGVHPTAGGSQLWANTAKTYLSPAIKNGDI